MWYYPYTIKWQFQKKKKVIGIFRIFFLFSTEEMVQCFCMSKIIRSNVGFKEQHVFDSVNQKVEEI